MAFLPAVSLVHWFTIVCVGCDNFGSLFFLFSIIKVYNSFCFASSFASFIDRCRLHMRCVCEHQTYGWCTICDCVHVCMCVVVQTVIRWDLNLSTLIMNVENWFTNYLTSFFGMSRFLCYI